MKKFIFPSIFIIMLLASGCQGTKSSNNAAYDLRTDKSAPNYMSNPLTGPNKNRIIGNDVTNQNPNFLNLQGTRNGNASGGSGNIGTDVDTAKKVIAKTKEFRTESVWINNDRMYVSVFNKGNLTKREVKDAEVRLHRKLVHAVPRYNISVKVKEARR
ncbi:hypothetical protein NDK43_29855 [Neobacillus pocheonensis]|uniref:Sporulation protein n=1 Tax=Neobacillus pocheonensis TaxID=363869 RepID=A0ABT0WJ80_9BACI|nr:hypothetical protein [Neobacillus pocheonensis]